MADNVALGIANGEVDGQESGTTPRAMRMAQGAQWQTCGILTGLEVAGTTSMAYSVSEGVAVVSRGDGDGKAIAMYDGGLTPTVSANNSSDQRIDVIWIAAHDLQHGDDDNFVYVGVTEGTASASPVKPTIPSYATELATVTVPAGATATSGVTKGTARSYAMPYGSSKGVLAERTFTSNQFITGNCHMVTCSVSLPTDRILLCNITITASANNGVYPNGEGSVYAHLKLDGADVAVFEVRLFASDFAGSTCYQHAVEVSKGTHNLQLFLEQTSATSQSVQLYYAKNRWAGQQLQVIDGGVIE